MYFPFIKINKHWRNFKNTSNSSILEFPSKETSKEPLQNLRGCNTVKISTCIIVGAKAHSTHITTCYFWRSQDNLHSLVFPSLWDLCSKLLYHSILPIQASPNCHCIFPSLPTPKHWSYLNFPKYRWHYTWVFDQVYSSPEGTTRALQHWKVKWKNESQTAPNPKTNVLSLYKWPHPQPKQGAILLHLG